MTDPVLVAIGDDLQRSARRLSTRRRRRRLVFALAVCATAFAAVTGAVAGVVDPLVWVEGLRGGFAQPAPDAPRIDLELHGHAGTWHVVDYLARDRALCDTAALDGRSLHQAGCAAGILLAPDPGGRNAGLAGLAFYPARRGWRLIAGAVDADVDGVVLEDGSGRRYPAKLSRTTIVVPVVVPAHGLTAKGRRLAAHAPRRLVLRAYAAELPRSRHPHRSRSERLAAPPVRFRLHWRDGRTTSAAGPAGSG